MRFLLVVTSILMTSELSRAQNFDVVDDNDYVVVMPNQLQMSLSRDVAAPVIACEPVVKKVERNLAGINRCQDNSSVIPRTYCELLAGDLRRTLLGIENELMGTVASDVKQRWQMSIAATGISLEELNLYASSHNLLADQLIKAKPVISNAGEATIVFNEGSLSEKLSGASILRLVPTIQGDGVNSVVTQNRLTACEFLSGKLSLSAKAQVQYAYSVVKDADALHRLWDVRNKLGVIGQKPLAEGSKFILAGYNLGAFLMENDAEIKDEDVLKLSQLLLTSPFAVVPYRNEFQLGKLVPQIDRAIQKTLIVEGGV